jgi:hypothetical protein
MNESDNSEKKYEMCGETAHSPFFFILEIMFLTIKPLFNVVTIKETVRTLKKKTNTNRICFFNTAILS